MQVAVGNEADWLGSCWYWEMVSVGKVVQIVCGRRPTAASSSASLRAEKGRGEGVPFMTEGRDVSVMSKGVKVKELIGVDVVL